MDSALTLHRHRIETAILRLKASGPMETMKRGYAIVTSREKLVRSVQDTAAGERLKIRMADGFLHAEVMDTEQKG